MFKPQDLKKMHPSLQEIVAVSKTFSLVAIQEVMALGYTHFGENKAQELKEKASQQTDVTWHFIGHLQTNKVKDVIKYASWIHSVDSLKLITALDNETQKQQKFMHVLIQVNLSQESTKNGCNESEVENLIQAILKAPYLKCEGLMVMGPHTEDLDKIRTLFQHAHQLRIQLQKTYPMMTQLSMGMSHDYQIACEEGATLLRIGSLIFGNRKKIQ